MKSTSERLSVHVFASCRKALIPGSACAGQSSHSTTQTPKASVVAESLSQCRVSQLASSILLDGFEGAWVAII